MRETHLRFYQTPNGLPAYFPSMEVGGLISGYISMVFAILREIKINRFPRKTKSHVRYES